MQRTVRYVNGDPRSDPLIIVTTRRSMWNPLVWIGVHLCTTTRAYRHQLDGSIVDFNGNPVSPEILRDILDKIPSRKL